MSLMLLSLVNLLFDLGRSEEHAQKQRKVEALYYAEQTSAPLPEGADRMQRAESKGRRIRRIGGLSPPIREFWWGETEQGPILLLGR